MTRRKANTGPDFEILRHAIERCDADRVLGFYAEDAWLSVVNPTLRRRHPSSFAGRRRSPSTFARSSARGHLTASRERRASEKRVR